MKVLTRDAACKFLVVRGDVRELGHEIDFVANDDCSFVVVVSDF